MGAAALAWGGAGATGAGSALNAYGQSQGLNAMEDAWRKQQAAQAADDAQLQAQTLDTIGKAGQTFNPQPAQAQLQQKLGTVAANTAAAAQANIDRKAGNPESRALITSGIAGDAQHAQANAALIAQLQAYGLGLQHLNMLGRDFSLGRNLLAARERDRAGLAPMAAKVAGMQGGALRSFGTGLSGLGQAAMLYGFSRPGPGSAMSGGPGVGVTSAPPADTVLTPEGAVGTGYDWIGRPVWQGAT